MSFSSLLLGVLLILVIFNVGESVTRKLFLKKSFLIIYLAVSFIFSFISPITIGNFTLTFSGFIFPLIVSIYYLFKCKNMFAFLRVGVSVLLVTTLTLIYNSITYDFFEYSYLQPYMLLALVIGFSVIFISKTPTNSFLSLFTGYTLASVIHFLTKNLGSDYGIVEVGGEQIITMLFLSLVASLFGCYVYRKVKLIKRRRERSMDEKTYKKNA